PGMWMFRVNGARGVEVPVFLLTGRDLFDEAVDVGFELRVGLNGQGIGCAFDYLVDVGIVERITRRLFVGESLAAKRRARAQEVVQTSGLLVLLEGKRDSNLAIGLDTRRPEGIVKVNG